MLRAVGDCLGGEWFSKKVIGCMHILCCCPEILFLFKSTSTYCVHIIGCLH